MSKLVRTFMLLRFLAKIACNKLVAIVSGAFVRYIRYGRKQIAVTLDQGTLIGLQYKTRLSRKPYFRFLGVPYAKPPVNDLRFRPPVQHPGWSGELQAFSEGNMCMQYSLITNRIIGNEDCLYLNVFVPQEGSYGKKAVMVFIHGGIFNYGSSTLDKFSPDYLLDENVIVVTFNYRLNVLGFLNLDIDECPGNMGLKDQLLAINWTKTNISAFGGDANNITVFGESAGSASVHLHTLSPHCTGMFQKAIMQSGFGFNTWALIKNHRDIAVRLSKKLGCQSDNTLAIVQYLKSVPAKDLVRHSKFEDDSNILIYKFLPSIESNIVSNPFLLVHPELLVETAPTIPIIAGINNMEGLIGIDEERLKKLPDFRTTKAISSFFKSQYSEENIMKIKNFYFNDRNLECETTRLENIVHMHSDLFIIKDFHRSFHHLLEKDETPVYNYEFKFDGEINTTKNILFATRPTLRKSLKGACHADELSYLFYAQIFGFAPKANSPEIRMCKTMSKLWSNFAKTGNPNSSDLSFEWKNTSADEPKYLSIDGDDTKMVNEFLYSSRVKFWEDISETV